MNTPHIPTFQVLVESGLRKFDVVVPAIEELKKSYLPLKIKSVDDKEGYEKVSKALRFMITKRNEVEDKRKELKSDSLAYGKAVDSRAKEITFMLTPIEEHLRLEKERIDEEIEAIKEKKIREEQERLNIRNRRLLQAGMKLVGNEYFWQNPNDLAEVEILPSINLETMEDLSFDEYVEKISKLAKEQQLVFEAEQKRLSDERLKFEEEQKKFREEVARIKLQRTKMRVESLYSLGLKSNSNSDLCYADGQNLTPICFYPEYENVEDWELYLNNVKISIFKIEGDIKVKKLAQEQELLKEAELKALKEEKRVQDEKILAEQKEAERIAQLSDKEKFELYVKNLLEVEPPALKTAKWKKEVVGLRGLIENYE